MVSAVNKHRHGNRRGSAGRHMVDGANVRQSVFRSLYMGATTVLLGDNLRCVLVREDESNKPGGQFIPCFTTTTSTGSKAGQQGIVRTRRSQQAAVANAIQQATQETALGHIHFLKPCLRPQSPCRCATRHVLYTLSTLNGKTSPRRTTRDINHCTVVSEERVQHPRVDENDALPHRPELCTNARIQRRMTASQRWREASPGIARPAQVLAPTSSCTRAPYDTHHAKSAVRMGRDDRRVATMITTTTCKGFM